MKHEGPRPAAESSTASTLVELLRQRAARQPEERAYTFLVDGEEEAAHVTYAELDRRARRVGALLQGYGTAGERALLLYPPGLDFIAAFFGCLYAGVIGIPAPLPRLGRSVRVLSRLRAIANDARPMVALTTSRVLAAVKDLSQFPELSGTGWLTTDNVGSDLMEEWWAPPLSGNTLAYFQYTSGSTAAPKGVMVSHGNLLQSQRMIRGAFGHSERSVFVGWLPHYHDMGLVGNILQPLYLGCRCVLMSPLLFLQRPYRWLQAISRYGGTTSGGPNFAYDLCARKIALEDRSRLDLRSWRVAFNGSEPVRPETLERFSAAFSPHGFDPAAFHPVYGLAEATLLASGSRNGSAGVRSITKEESGAEIEDTSGVVSCGEPPEGQKIVIAEPEGNTRQPPGRIGEVWLSGPNVAQGYWNQPEETARVFQASLADTGEGPFLRTGDLGFLKDGELFVTGRLKDLIVIRGQNYYPQDIEWTVQESSESLRPWCCAAFSVRVDGEERLVVVAEVEPDHWLARRQDAARGFGSELRRPLDLEAVIGTIRGAVSEEYGLHAHAVLLVGAAGLPKTSSGKIQRHACRAAFQAGTLRAAGNESDERESYGT